MQSLGDDNNPVSSSFPALLPGFCNAKIDDTHDFARAL
jgi:hypothetical protein